MKITEARKYIKENWQILTRSLAHIKNAAEDPKVYKEPSQPWLVYISPQENFEEVKQRISEAISKEEFKQIELRVLPAEFPEIIQHGLLYLPGDYVVPGGRFNELYGWDSYFIVLGLLADGEVALAKSQIDQLLYEITHYGSILNANRTYLLTRSQPPFLTPMIMKLWEKQQDREWLESILPIVEKYYYYWTVPPHLNPVTGLSRYYDLGEGPAPEVIYSERDEGGRTHYERVKDFYRTHTLDDYDVNLYYDKTHDHLTDLFYKGDRSMRESGLDITNRFGAFSVDVIHYAPVCLNVLLYQMEIDLAKINRDLNRLNTVALWKQRAEERQKLINQFLWDEEAGLYFDYNFLNNHRRPYEYLTTFYPLWAGLASNDQAARVVANLPKFETNGGLRTSTQVTGNQWDAPFGWAPLHLIAVAGLARYGYTEEARRIADKFLTLLLHEFNNRGTLLEKYDVETCSARVAYEIHFGYSSNEIGFGWTNGVFLELLNYCSEDKFV